MAESALTNSTGVLGKHLDLKLKDVKRVLSRLRQMAWQDLWETKQRKLDILQKRWVVPHQTSIKSKLKFDDEEKGQSSSLGISSA